MIRRMVGKKDGRRVYGMYRHRAGELPELRIKGQYWRGSSLGPANYMCDPSRDDIEFWSVLAKGKDLID